MMEKIKSGKVRDIYQFDENHLLLLATDRLSAYDVIFPDLFPQKGVILTELAKWWMAQLSTILPTQWSIEKENLFKNIPQEEMKKIPENLRKDFPQRSMIVEKCKVIPFECIVRGYAFGSYLKENPQAKPMTPFATPLFTPTTKEESGHDQATSLSAMEKQLGPLAKELERQSLALFERGRKICEEAGLVLVDTKFEFGMDGKGTLRLIDECFTPDSSRYLLREDFERGEVSSYDKQVIRNHVDQMGWNRTPPAPKLPPQVIEETLRRYKTILKRITGKSL